MECVFACMCARARARARNRERFNFYPTNDESTGIIYKYHVHKRTQERYQRFVHARTICIMYYTFYPKCVDESVNRLQKKLSSNIATTTTYSYVELYENVIAVNAFFLICTLYDMNEFCVIKLNRIL